ncbi:hypothetical protein GVAV_000215 [Gurleya vavrai]
MNTHWSLKTYARKVKSTEIKINRKSIEPIKKFKKSTEIEVVKTPKKVYTPVRKIEFLSPNDLLKIKGSPKCKRYKSARKIDF